MNGGWWSIHYPQSHSLDLNQRPDLYKRPALPAELEWHGWVEGFYYTLNEDGLTSSNSDPHSFQSSWLEFCASTAGTTPDLLHHYRVHDHICYSGIPYRE